MRSSQIRYSIDKIEALPIVPCVAWRLLEVLSRSPVDVAALAHLGSSDPAVAAQLLRHGTAAHAAAPKGVPTVYEIMSELDSDALRGRLLQIVVSSLTSANISETPEVKAHWGHSLRTAVYAERFAGHLQSPFNREAFLAGLLHDIGKLVLLAIEPDRYATACETARQARLAMLKAEQRAFGLDHTLAGKWLAERWKLPDVLTRVIWLHHHPPGSLDQTCYPVALIDMVALASELAAGELSGATEDATTGTSINERLARLGVTGDTIHTLCRQAGEVIRTREALFENLSVEQTDCLTLLRKAAEELQLSHVRLSSQNSRLKRQAFRFAVLHEMNAKIDPGQSLHDLLGILAIGFRQAFRIAPGMCLACHRNQHTIEGAVWSAMEGAPHTLFLQVDEMPSSDMERMDEHLIATLEKRANTRKDAAGACLRELLGRPGLAIVPLVVRDTHTAHILFDVAAIRLNLNEQEYSSFAAFVEAAAKAITRYQTENHLRGEVETLVESMRYRESRPSKSPANTAGPHTETKREPPRPAGEEQKGQPPTILVADDSSALRNVIAEVLQTHGYHVRTAANGREAMNVITGNRLDLVLLDLQISEPHGRSVLAEVRASGATLPVIVMTGGASQEEVDELLKLGARACLSKPFQIRHLLAEIEKVFSRHSR